MACDDHGVMATLVDRAGYGPGDPLLVAVQWAGRSPVFVAQGRPWGGARLTATTRVYTASLSKQLTAACAGLLAQAGRLDIESPLARWLPELPSWAAAIRLRHLVHHTGLAVIAPADNTDRHIPLADALLDELTGTTPRPDG